MLNCAVMLLAGTMVVGQANADSPTYEHLKVMKPLIGKWVHEGELKEDLAGMKAGEVARLEWSFRWILNKAALRWEWTITSGGKQVLKGIEHLGWNANKSKIVSVMFATDGSMDTSEWTAEDNRFTSHFSGVQADGTEFRGDVILTVMDKDTVTWKAVGYAVGDVSPIDTTEYRYSRK